jgi:hypothetical protein
MRRKEKIELESQWKKEWKSYKHKEKFVGLDIDFSF